MSTLPENPVQAQQVLRDVFGFAAFRPGQERVIASLLGGRDVLAVMPTGSGKSLCFQIPALVRGGLTVVVSPLIALMQDQVAALHLAEIPAACINSSQDRAQNAATWQRVHAGEIRLLYLSPELLMMGHTLEKLSQLGVWLFAIDEAHCISQWGPAFRPEYEMLAGLRAQFPETRIIALTATADVLTREDIAQKLFGGDVELCVLGFDRPNIRLAVAPKQSTHRQILEVLSRHPEDSGIIYCLSRAQTEKTATRLQEKSGIQALPYHAGMSQARRSAHQQTFMAEPGVIIVATIAFGMGIDKPDVRFVIHIDLPGSIEAYYQELGRAGRDGKPAEAVMFYGLADIVMRRRFIDNEEAGAERARREHKRLDALLSYCESPRCRRIALLNYFGETIQPCGNCDMCLNPGQLRDGTQDGQKALSAVYRTGQRFGAAYIVDVLLGSDTARIQANGHERLPTFGVGKELPKSTWHSLIRQLLAAGFLQLDIGGYGGLSITPAGHKLLRGHLRFECREILMPKRQSSPTPAPKHSVTVKPADETLLTALKQLRRSLAEERNVPAYVIFHDRTLIEMASHRPRNPEEFSSLNGVGKAKLEAFAEPFLRVIATAEGSTD